MFCHKILFKICLKMTVGKLTTVCDNAVTMRDMKLQFPTKCTTTHKTLPAMHRYCFFLGKLQIHFKNFKISIQMWDPGLFFKLSIAQLLLTQDNMQLTSNYIGVLHHFGFILVFLSGIRIQKTLMKISL